MKQAHNMQGRSEAQLQRSPGSPEGRIDCKDFEASRKLQGSENPCNGHVDVEQCLLPELLNEQWHY